MTTDAPPQAAVATGRRVRIVHRIDLGLPVSIAGLLTVVVALVAGVAYLEMRDEAVTSAKARLSDVGHRLGEMTTRSMTALIDGAEKFAVRPRLRDALLDPAAEPKARALLAPLVEHSPQLVLLELWSADGTLRLAVPNLDVADAASSGGAAPDWADARKATLGGFRRFGNEVVLPVAAPVRDGDRLLGHVVQVRRMSTSPESLNLLGELVGRQGSILVQDAHGTWTDFSEIVDGPPPQTGDAPLEYEDRSGRRWLGTGDSLRGVGWNLWVRIPADTVTARAETFAEKIAWIGGVVVLFGAFGGWLLSRRITRPLASLTRAATAMADGDLAQGVAVEGPDELGYLAGAFNTMANHVRATNEDLERRIDERTRELQASEARFRSLAATAHDGIVAADGDGAVTYFNPGAERIFGFAESEMIGRQVDALVPEALRQAHRDGMARYRETGEGRLVGRTVELTGRRKDGTEFPVEIALAGWTTAEGPEFAAILRDVSDRRQAEESLRRTAAELLAANQELNAFSYSVSHDLRAPLRAINGFSTQLAEDHADRLGEDGVACLARIRAAVARMEHLIDDLLELSRVTRQEMRRDVVDLSRAAQEVVADLRADSPDRTVEVRIAPDVRATGDLRLLRLVLQNLLGNAWKFTSKRASAHIEFGRTDGPDAAFFVRDDGVGFDMAYVEKLFGVFQRLHSVKEYPGTGVGLAIVQRIVQRHGGRIWAESAVDRGATFYFTLPPA